MTSAFVNPSWMPHSVGEAARAGDATADDLLSGRAWSHLLDSLRRASEVVLADAGRYNAADMAAGFRHLLVLLGIGLDNALREESGSVLAVKPSGVDSIYKWGMDCPDCIYTGSGLRGGETYRLWGNRGSARYVGLQSMAGMASSANVLLDELDLGPDGEVDLILSAEPHEGNWLAIAENATALVVRHFFYDWDTEVASSLYIERIGAKREKAARPAEDPRAVVARQLIALGDFVVANLEFFLQFSRPETPNTFLPPLDGTAMGAAAENRPGHRVLGARARRGAGAGGLTAAGPVLELLTRESLVGDHRLRLASEQPQRTPGDRGRRRHPPRRHRPRGPRVSPTGSTRPGTASARSFCAASARRRLPCRRCDWSSSPRSIDAVPAGTRRVTPEERQTIMAARTARREQAVLPMMRRTGRGRHRR